MADGKTCVCGWVGGSWRAAVMGGGWRVFGERGEEAGGGELREGGSDER